MLDTKLLAPTATDVTELTLRHFDSLDAQITRDQLTDMCARFGVSSWEDKFVNTHPTGFTIAHAMDRDGDVSASTFATWWLGEERYETLLTFLKNQFGEDVTLLERQNDSCWFKIRESVDTDTSASLLKLSNVFEAIENSKSTLGVREYSVSQTTLEQIFNTFASQQTADEAIPTTPLRVRTKRSSSVPGGLA
jgi:ATP-binding cassette, subfamily A (ABC1), member 3